MEMTRRSFLKLGAALSAAGMLPAEVVAKAEVLPDTSAFTFGVSMLVESVAFRATADRLLEQEVYCVRRKRGQSASATVRFLDVHPLRKGDPVHLRVSWPESPYPVAPQDIAATFVIPGGAAVMITGFELTTGNALT